MMVIICANELKYFRGPWIAHLRKKVKRSKCSPFSPQKHNLKTRDSLIWIICVHQSPRKFLWFFFHNWSSGFKVLMLSNCSHFIKWGELTLVICPVLTYITLIGTRFAIVFRAPKKHNFKTRDSLIWTMCVHSGGHFIKQFSLPLRERWADPRAIIWKNLEDIHWTRGSWWPWGRSPI
jgi:hypothetical protein